MRESGSRRWVAACVGLAFLVLTSVGAMAMTASPSQALETDYPVGGSCLFAAHRGVDTDATENSLSSLQAAVDDGADYLEMDVQVTSDGYFVLMHDETLDRTSTGHGRIIDKTYAQVRALRLDDGQRIPRLSWVLAMAAPTPSDVLLELKWVPSSRFAQFQSLVDRFGSSRVVVNSFSTYVVRTFHQRYPDARTALDTSQPISITRARSYGGVMPDWRHVSDDWLADLRAAGVETYLWTVDTAAGWQRFSGKVTLLLTNRATAYTAWRRTHC